MPLEFVYSQIIASHINKRKDFYNFMLTNHKNKDAALSLKVNNFPLFQGDELRFPNIETQIIYDDYDIPMVYLNKKLKYIKHHLNQIHIICDIPLDEVKLDIKKVNNLKRVDFSKSNNICLSISKMPNIIINKSFNNLTKLFIKISDLLTKEININIPSLKILRIWEANNSNILLNTMKLKILIIPRFNSLTINQHNILCFDTNCDSINKIKCDFNYPFLYNGVICHNINNFTKLINDINSLNQCKTDDDYGKMLELINKYYNYDVGYINVYTEDIYL